MTSPRHPKWHSRLAAVNTSFDAKPFVWGETDCVYYIFACIEAVIDKTPAYFGYDQVVGSYTTRKEALQAIKALGAESLLDLVSAKLQDVPLAMAQVGDIVALPSELGGWVLGIVIGERISLMTETGRGTKDRSEAVRAFSVDSA